MDLAISILFTSPFPFRSTRWTALWPALANVPESGRRTGHGCSRRIGRCFAYFATPLGQLKLSPTHHSGRGPNGSTASTGTIKRQFAWPPARFRARSVGWSSPSMSIRSISQILSARSLFSLPLRCSVAMIQLSAPDGRQLIIGNSGFRVTVSLDSERDGFECSSERSNDKIMYLK